MELETKHENHRYQLGLGSLNLNAKANLRKQMSVQNREKLYLMEAEKKREADLALMAVKRSNSFYDRIINSNKRTAKTVRELQNLCDTFTSEKYNLHLPQISNHRGATNPKSFDFKLPLSTMGFSQTSEESKSFFTTLLTERREPAREFIENSKGILRSKIMIQNKKKETNRMKEYIERKEALLKLNKEIYEQDKKMIDDYINLAKQDANIQKREVTKKIMEREKKEDQLAELKSQQIKIGRAHV